MTVFVGDCHGKTEQLMWMMKHNPKLSGKKIFQLGDMGLGFSGVHLPEPPNLKFIRGNHDDPAKCKAHPCYAGEYGYMAEEKLFFLGGAWSIDFAWRTPMISWWPDEEQSEEELDKAFGLYVDSKPRLVATHECPTEAAISMIGLITHGGHVAAPTDQGVREKGADYAYYKAKLGCANTRTSKALQRMFDAHKPEQWVFGHYHVDTTFELQGCTFHCLNELSTKEIVLLPQENPTNETLPSKD